MNYHRSITPSANRRPSRAIPHFPSFAGLSQIDEVFDRLRSPMVKPAHQVAVDLFEDDDSYFARFELPGLKKDRLELLSEGRILTLNVMSESEALVEDESAEAEEESTTRAAHDPEILSTRSLKLPEDADGSGVVAKLEDGLLTLTIPKKEEAKPRSIDIA